jgi:hypothetical protein
VHARAAGLSHRNIGAGARGALSASGAFRGLGRQVAFASSYFLGGAGFIYGAKSAITAASDLSEQIAKTNVVFGRNGQEVIRWSRTMATGFGLSERSALTYAGSFGALLRPLGVRQAPAARLSKNLVERAADIASFYNTSEDDALQALQSGLVGQVRPLRRFGVQLSEDRVKAFAFTHGIAKPDVDQRKVGEAEDKVTIATVKLAEARRKHGVNSVEAASAAVALKTAEDGLHKALAGSNSQLTAQQKTLARYAIIMHDSSLAKGDFARSSDRLANSEKILKAQLEGIEVQVGNALMPTVLHYTHSLSDWLSKSKNQATVTRDVKAAVHALVIGVRVAGTIIKTAAKWASALAHAVGGWKNAFKIVLAGLLATKLLKIAAGIRNIYIEASLASGGKGVGGLIGSLKRLQGIGPISVPIAIAVAGIVGAKILQGLVARGNNPLSQKAKHPFGVGDGGNQNDAARQIIEDNDVWPGHEWLRYNGATYHWTGKKWVKTSAPGQGQQSDAHNLASQAAADRNHPAGASSASGAPTSAETAAEGRARARRQRLLAEQRRMAAAAKREAAQMRLLGFDSGGSPLAPTKAALKRELGNVSEFIKGTILDTGAHRSMLAKIRRLLSGQLGALSADMRSKIKELLDDLKGQMNEFDGFNLTAADRRRRFLDKNRADRYGGKADHPTTSGGKVKHVHTHTHTYKIDGNPGESMENKIRRAHWRLRTQLA